MAGYDILMIAVLAGTTLWGAFKGAAWQVAALASLGVSYFASYHLSDSLTSSGLFGQTAPWNRFAAMLTIYIITGIVIWMGFRVISETIEKIKLKDFDRQLGALFGLLKGVIFCVLITFFVVTLSPSYRETVINTRSGRYVAKLLSKAEAIMPPELQTVLEPYIKRFEENMQPSNVAGQSPNFTNPNGSQPQPWSAGMPNIPAWGNSGTSGNFGNQPNPNGPVPHPGNTPGFGSAPHNAAPIHQPPVNQAPVNPIPHNPGFAPNQPGYGQPLQPLAPGYGYPNPGPQNPYGGVGGAADYSTPPLQPVVPQQSPYPQSYSPTPPAIDPPRYGEPGFQFQPTGYFPSQPPAQFDPNWGARVPPYGAWNR